MNPSFLPEKHRYAYFHPGAHLLTYFPVGVLTNARADQTIEFLETREEQGNPFHRFVDLTGYTRIQLDLDHLVRLARRRRDAYQGLPVKSALFALRLLHVSIAKMYEELMRDSLIEVRVFRERQMAADWLGVPPALLVEPNVK